MAEVEAWLILVNGHQPTQTNTYTLTMTGGSSSYAGHPLKQNTHKQKNTYTHVTHTNTHPHRQTEKYIHTCNTHKLTMTGGGMVDTGHKPI